MKKLAFAFILILLCALPTGAFAEELFSFSFETEDGFGIWSGGIADRTNAYESEYSLFVSNPFGEIKNNHATHVLDYSPTITLEAGKVYTLSGYVMNPVSSYNPSVRTSARLAPGANTILVNISGIGDEWEKFSTTFYAGESGEYNLSLHFAQGYVDFGFFVDELVLKETQCTLFSLEINGPEEILIPAAGSTQTYYIPYLISSDGETIEILSSSSMYFSVSKAAGISFNSYAYSLSVSSDAVPDTTVTIDCTLRNYANLSPTSLTLTLTDNMIDNSDFQSENTLWTSSSTLTQSEENGNKYIRVPTNDYGDFGYFATIEYESPQLLLEDVVYVIHARIKSDSAEPFSAIHAMNSAENINNTVYFAIKDISGEEWLDVFAAFVPESSGVYNIALNVCSRYDCTIYVDDIRLSSEVLKPQYITLHAPGNIALPNTATDYPVSALLRDQLGNILPTDEVTVSLKEDIGGIKLNSEQNLITVQPDTIAGKYTLHAEYKSDPAINAELSFTVSYDYMGDGSFENTLPNEWWLVSSPYECDFYMRHDGYSRRALINCKGDYFMLLNNSYVHLQNGTPYVFNSAFATATDCTATLFIETLDSEMIPLAQVSIAAGTTLDEKILPELFLAEEDTVGRLFLYVQSDNAQPFTLYADNLSLKAASIVAVNPHITGVPYINGAVEAEFTLFNNIAENNDTSACAINWYVSDNPYSGFSQIVSVERNIYFDTTFLDKYVYFEIIPICPVTGFSGTPIRSMPFLVTYNPSDDAASRPMFTPVIKPSGSQSSDYFLDIGNHWAKDYINTLAANEIVDGKGEGLFDPDSLVTRAEFAKMLSISFSIDTQASFSPFKDISVNDWFYKYVSALNLAEIINGTSYEHFSPYLAVKREEAATMIIRLYEKTNTAIPPADLRVFVDEDSISQWAIDSVKDAASLGILAGNPDGSFQAQKELTRAEAAAIICRLSDVLNKSE